MQKRKDPWENKRGDYSLNGASWKWKIDNSTIKTEQNRQMLLPEKLKPVVLRSLHNEMGHVDADKVFILPMKDSSGPRCNKILRTM